jgi:hypothetical protein
VIQHAALRRTTALRVERFVSGAHVMLSKALEDLVNCRGWHGMQGVRGSNPLSSTTTTPQGADGPAFSFQRWYDRDGKGGQRPGEAWPPARQSPVERQAKQLEGELRQLVIAMAPALLTQPGIGPVNAAQLLISWSHPGRFWSEAAFAMLAGAAPVQASSGQVVRHRLNRGGDRQLHRARTPS